MRRSPAWVTGLSDVRFLLRGIGDNGVAIVSIVVVAGVTVRVHLEEIVVVRVGRTLPPIVVVGTGGC